MMRTAVVAGVLLASVLGCGHVPQTHYYLFDYERASVPGQTLPVIIGVASVEVVPPYDQERLVFRRSRHEVEFYHYHRWVESPAQLVRRCLLRDLAHSQRFRDVVPFPGHGAVDYLLSVRVERMEERDEGQAWFSCLELQCELRRAKGLELVHGWQVDEREAVAERSPAGVVQALTRCLERASARIIRETTEKLASM
ncbi:MAG: membrane integrity-associated transporter subunit PqiC [Calditrichaeota bacterium]|nr:membrane integrity-associated transporter subunit PqiC [Calditrichota bacterium]